MFSDFRFIAFLCKIVFPRMIGMDEETSNTAGNSAGNITTLHYHCYQLAPQ